MGCQDHSKNDLYTKVSKSTNTKKTSKRHGLNIPKATILIKDTKNADLKSIGILPETPLQVKNEPGAVSDTEPVVAVDKAEHCQKLAISKYASLPLHSAVKQFQKASTRSNKSVSVKTSIKAPRKEKGHSKTSSSNLA